MIGTAVAQAIPLAILPVFTRVLTSEQLGEYFLWMSVASILASVAPLSLDQAIFLAKNDDKLRCIVRALVITTFSICAGSYLVFVFLELLFASSLFPGLLAETIPVAIIYACSFALSQGVISVYLYRSNFLGSSVLKVTTSGAIGLLQLVFLAMGGALMAIIAAQTIACVVITGFMMRKESFWPFGYRFLSQSNIRTLREHHRFVIYSTPATLVNMLATQLPLFIVSAKFGSGPVAFYALANKVLTVPAGLLAGSILAVFKDSAGTEFRETGQCTAAFKKAFKSLFVIAFPPFILLYFLAEKFFIVFFGDDWQLAGGYAKLMIPMVFLGFLASPLSYTLLLAQRQTWNLYWQIGLLVMTVSVFYLSESLEESIFLYSALYSGFYILLLQISYLAAKGK